MPSLSRLTSIVNAVGDTNCAVLAYRVMYWAATSAKRVTRRPEVTFVAGTRTWWMEQTGLTRHQYDRALKILTSSGMVLARHAPEPGQRFGTATHLALTEEALEALLPDNQLSAGPDNQVSALADDYKKKGLGKALPTGEDTHATPPEASAGLQEVEDDMKGYDDQPKSVKEALSLTSGGA